MPNADAAPSLEQQQTGDVQRRWRMAACHVEQGEEKNRADAVVEERLAGQLGLNCLGNAGAAQHFEHGDGIGGRNERAEDEALHPGMRTPVSRNMSPATRKTEQTVPTTERSETVSFSLRELLQVEQKGAGKEQQRQHAVQDHALEVDVEHQVRRPLMNCGNAPGGQHRATERPAPSAAWFRP